MAKKLSEDEVRARLASKGLSWVGGTYENCRSRLTLRCTAGHTFTVQAQSPLSLTPNSNKCRECDLLRRFGPKPRGRTRKNNVLIKFYTDHSWITMEVPDNTTTTELNERYGRNNWEVL